MSKVKDSNGWWEIKNNPISKVGVFPYMGRSISGECEPDKVYYVYRPATTLEQSVDTWDNPPKPFINDHEMLGEGFSKIDDRPVQGVIHNPHFEDGVLYADLSVYSESLKDKIANGKKELSLGYFCKYRKEKGVYKGQTYDFVQEDMVGNHIALVDSGRCGSDVKVFDSKCTMDSFDIVSDEFEEKEHPRDDDGKFTDKNGGAENSNAEFAVLKETKKAKLLRKDGKSFWVQKRWIKEDGGLTPAGLRSFENAPTDTEIKKQKQERKEAWQNGIKIPKADWESDKAYGFDIKLDFYDLEKGIKERVFIPKSVIQENGNIPSWILNAKLAELELKYRNKGGFIIEESPFENGALKKTWDFETGCSNDLKKNQETANMDNEETTTTKDGNMVDKRKDIRKIMAIAAKPDSEFEGGEEEKVETIAKLLETSEYAKSKDEAEKEEKAEDKCGKDEESEEKEAKDKCGKDEEEKETEDEEVSPADVMAFLKMILEEVRSLNGKKTTDEEEKKGEEKAEDEDEAEKKSEDDDDDKKESEDEDEEEKKEAKDSSDVIITFAKDSREAPKSFMDDPALRKYLNI